MNDENLIWESYKKSVFSEAPVDEISTMGDWNDPKKPQKRKYDAPSIKILTKDSYLQKLKTQFAKNVPYNFNLFFLKSKNAPQGFLILLIFFLKIPEDPVFSTRGKVRDSKKYS